MIHVRLIVPTGLTDRVAELLLDDERATHVAITRGAGLEPPGDLVQCDLAREAASEIIDALRDLGVDGDQVGIALEEISAAPSRLARRAEQAAPGSPEDGIVWDVVVGRAYDDATISWSFYAFLLLATVIASIAVVTDSAILVVGAMVVGPEFGPVAAVAVGIALRRVRLIRDAVILLVSGFVLAVALTAMLAALARPTGLVTAEQLLAPRPLTGFIWRPDEWSVIVALLAGMAGVLSLTAGRANVLVGVFISVTTVPAAGNLALALGLWVPEEIGGSLTQLGVNLLGMTVSGTALLAVQRLLTKPRARRRERSATA